MLSEWFTYLTTDCLPQARKLGYLRESIGIRSRYRRCRSAWQLHLENSQSVLLQSLNMCDNFRTALVLGSGVLLVVPLVELSRRFEKVLLVDMVHLPEVRRAARRLPNVHCISCDITGFLEGMNGMSPHNLDLPLPDIFLDDSTVDWVASVNLLSQLPLLPLAWMRMRFPEINEARLEQWSTRLMRQHLDYLATFSVPVCLLTDIAQTTYGQSGEVIDQSDFSMKFNLETQALQQWRWDIAPAGEIAPGVGRFHRVVAHNMNSERCRE